MKKLTCEVCGSTDIIKQDGLFVCQSCGTKYSLEEAKKIMAGDAVTEKKDTVNFQEKDFKIIAGKLKKYKGLDKKVVIPSIVTTIDDFAFCGHEGLTSVTIPDSVTGIGKYAFSGCDSLTDIVIPDSVTSIGQYAFNGCESLTSITIGNGVTRIEYEAFKKCTELMNVHITDLAAWCGIYFASYDANPLYYAKNLYLNGTLITDLVIPEGVTDIRDYAFYNYPGLDLTSVVIPNSVTSIGQYAFYGCKNLTSVTIGNSVTKIEHYAFDGCKSLTSVTIPDSVTSIGQYAFYGCKSLTSVTIPNSVIFLLHDAFGNCDSLKTVYVPGNLDVKDEFPKSVKIIRTTPGGCYIATCVYGSYDCPQVWTLRRYRDDTLGATWYGRLFIRFYYAVSPTLVKWFGKTRWFQKFWRGKLDRKIKELQKHGVKDTPYQDRDWRK